MCAEDVPFFPSGLRTLGPPTVGPRSAASQNPPTLMGDALVQAALQQCKIWPAGEVPADFHSLFESQVPVLILSGEYDPVTPPAYGKRALLQYPQGRHLIGAGQGHGLSSRGCMPKVLDRFISAGTTLDLDAGCLDRLGDVPFFTSLLGSAP